MRVAHAKLACKRGQAQTFLATQCDECMRALDQFIDAAVEMRSALQVANHRKKVSAHRRYEVLIRQDAPSRERVAALKAAQQVRLQPRLQYGLGRLHDSGANGLVKNRTLALDPMFRPAHGGIRFISMPRSRKQDKHRAGFHGARLARVLAFKEARALRNKDDLIALEHPSTGPFKMVACRMPGRGILCVRLYSRKANRSRRAPPNIVRRLLGQIDEIVAHTTSETCRQFIYGKQHSVHS